MLQSIIAKHGAVPFPEHTGEKVYMLPFFKKDGLPRHLERWQPTVDAMLSQVDTDDVIYIMIDQGVVSPSKSHRRGGMHIDGYWIPELQTHGRHATQPPGHRTERHCTTGAWPIEGILLASDVSACKALSGSFKDDVREGGDCSHLDLSSLTHHTLEAGFCYAGNVTMLHESVPTKEEQLRTLVRMNVPSWSPLH